MDILQEYCDSDLNNLALFYEKHINSVPYVYSFIKTAIEWKSKGHNNLTKFYTPKDWEKNGTFIAIMQFGHHDTFVFTLEETCEELCNCLLKTKIINWEKPLVFFNLHSKHYDPIQKVFKELNLTENYCNHLHMYCISPEKALSFNIEHSNEETYVKKLDTNYAPFIDGLYKNQRYRHEHIEDYIKTLIELNGGFGVFSKKNDELLSWVMKTCLGQIGLLQTLETATKKGYASLLTKMISKEIAELGFTPYAAIFTSNTASKQLFEKLGYQIIGECYFLEVVKNK